MKLNLIHAWYLGFWLFLVGAFHAIAAWYTYEGIEAGFMAEGNSVSRGMFAQYSMLWAEIIQIGAVGALMVVLYVVLRIANNRFSSDQSTRWTPILSVAITTAFLVFALISLFDALHDYNLYYALKQYCSVNNCHLSTA